jgi:hypothetical protein
MSAVSTLIKCMYIYIRGTFEHLDICIYVYILEGTFEHLDRAAYTCIYVYILEGTFVYMCTHVYMNIC